MDDKEQQDLAKEMENVSIYGHTTEAKKVSTRSGRGFRWNTQTGKYEAL